MNIRRLTLLILTLLVAILFFNIVDVPEFVLRLQNAYGHSPLLTIILFCATFVLVTFFGLPGAAFLSIASGFLFGFGQGLLYTSIACGISAVLSFLLARYALQGFVSKKFPKVVKIINEGMEQDGTFYIFFLRMIPLFPFPALNMSFGLTKIKVFKYWWVSQIAMLPLSALFVNAGTGVTDIASIEGVMNQKLILSLIAVAILPLIFKVTYEKVRKPKSVVLES